MTTHLVPLFAGELPGDGPDSYCRHSATETLAELIYGRSADRKRRCDCSYHRASPNGLSYVALKRVDGAESL